MNKDIAPKRDSVIIYSGGLDSTTLLYEERERIALAVTFDYGSNHAARETACARHHCALLGVEHLVVELGFMGRYFNSSLLSGADAIPDGDYNDENMRSTVVPFRNGIMLSVACGLAESRGLRRVLIANHGGDHAIYPDCRPAFVAAMDGAMQAGTYEGVRLAAPYTNISKADIVRRGVALGIDYGHTYSCYRGGERHCGTCGTCSERREAFREAGVTDPTVYENSNPRG
jgi:7-cyano-7-deazaguanine synthase